MSQDKGYSAEARNQDIKANFLSPGGIGIDRGNKHWMVPRQVNGLFTGRVKLLLRIQEALRNNHTSPSDEQKRFVITGLGGQGKSEICLKVASLMREE